MVVVRMIAIGLALSVSSGAWASSCTGLDYQEMKEMSAGELTKEYCELVSSKSNVIDTIVDLATSDGSDAATQAAYAESAKCEGQIRRLLRVAEQKGEDPKAMLAECRNRSKSASK